MDFYTLAVAFCNNFLSKSDEQLDSTSLTNCFFLHTTPSDMPAIHQTQISFFIQFIEAT